MLTHKTAIAWNVLASGVTQSHGYSIGRPLTQMVSQQSAMIAYNYLFRATAIVFRALNAAHLLDQEAETTSRTGDRRRRIAQRPG